MVPRIKISLSEAPTYSCEYRLAGSRFRQMPVGADVFEVKRRNACPVCVWGTPKPIRGHYFRGREEYGGTQRKEEDEHEQRFLKKAFDKTKYR